MGRSQEKHTGINGYLMAKTKYALKGGWYTQEFIEALAMAGHIGIVKPHEIAELLANKPQADITAFLNDLVVLNRQAYRGR